MLMIENALQTKIDNLLPQLIAKGDLVTFWGMSERSLRVPTPQEVLACLERCPELTWWDDQPDQPVMDDTGTTMEAGGPSDAPEAQEEVNRGRDEGGVTPTAQAEASSDDGGNGVYDVPSDEAVKEILEANDWFVQNGYYAHARICALAASAWGNSDGGEDDTNDRLRHIGEEAWDGEDFWTALQCIEEFGDIDLMLQFADDLAERSERDEHAHASVIIEAYNTAGEVEKLVAFGDKLSDDEKFELALEAYLDAGAGNKALNLIDDAATVDDGGILLDLIDDMCEYVEE